MIKSDECCLKEFVNKNIGKIWYARCPKCKSIQPYYTINDGIVRCAACGMDLMIKRGPEGDGETEDHKQTFPLFKADFKNAVVFAVVFTCVCTILTIAVRSIAGSAW